MKTISIGDIHGRDNWKLIEPIADQFDKIIFIADYVDSFNVSNIEILHNLNQIINFKLENPNKVELLMGNHDMQYMFAPFFRCSGFRAEMMHDLQHLFREHKSLFNICYKYNNYIFTHAGITKGWIKFAKPILDRFDLADDFSNIDICLNNLLHVGDNWILNTYSEKRGGMRGDCGSPIWADRIETVGDRIDNFKQIVGHTPIDNIQEINDVYYIDCLGKDNVSIKDFLILNI